MLPQQTKMTTTTTPSILKRSNSEVMSIRNKFRNSCMEIKNLQRNRESIGIFIVDIFCIVALYKLANYLSLSFHYAFFLFEARHLIRTSVIIYFDGSMNVKVFIFRYIFSRLVTLYFVFDELIDLPYYLGYIIFPLFLSWYFFEPFLIRRGFSYSDRFSYCIDRYPYFYLIGVIPTIFLALEWSLLYEVSVVWIHNSIAASPEHLPFSRYKFNTDITDVIEQISSKILT